MMERYIIRYRTPDRWYVYQTCSCDDALAMVRALDILDMYFTVE